MYVSEKQKFDRYHYSIFVDSFLNHDYTEKDELKVSLFHLLQCKHGSETNQQYSITRNLFSALKYSYDKKIARRALYVLDNDIHLVEPKMAAT